MVGSPNDYGALTQRTPMPGPVLVTALAFAVLTALFALAAVLRVLAEDGSFGAALFFGVMSVACAVVALSLAGRRPWAVIPAYVLSGLLAVASLGLFGAITIVGVGLLGWVLWALTRPASRDWLADRRRLR